MKAFSLIEAMLAVAIMGIIASIAVPNLLPVLHRAELGGATDNLLSLVSRARVQAFADRRCIQLLLIDKVPGAQQTISLRSLNTLDCDGVTAHTQTIASAPRLTAGAPLWTEIDHFEFDSARVVARFINHPASLTNAEGADLSSARAPGVASGQELRMRSNGRIWSPDDDLANDDVTVEIRHERSGETKTFRIRGIGTVVDRPAGT